jgi:hypothetical protein
MVVGRWEQRNQRGRVGVRERRGTERHPGGQAGSQIGTCC